MPTEALLTQLELLLRQHPQGLTEFDLLRRLQQAQGEGFDTALFRDNLSLFRAHFLLFHALYQLNDQLLQRRQGQLEIHVLRIRLHPWQQGLEGLTRADPLRAYYLDLSQLRETTAEDVETLLGRFWSGYMNDEQRDQALRALGLTEAADSQQIEQSYRRLAMRHHPDRGGDDQTFQRIEKAVRVLRRAL
ncbi:MAG: DnaJ domain-containing protein [Gammaproteobacteria bacterium SHHR-1]|uniref:DNA-J related domain-containing protein n=1 Tax=Magnetovirga frankeli TaxID=947516 RepID=UPI001293C67E|nr:DnaJ domain-containing protein [gamma proteobacterium SS-5]